MKYKYKIYIYNTIYINKIIYMYIYKIECNISYIYNIIIYI